MGARSQARTSETHPIEVGWLGDERPRIGLTIAPGKRARSGLGQPWARDLAADLDRLAEHHGAGLLVCLLEKHELKTLEILGLFEEAEKRGIEVLHHPIRDGGVPASTSRVCAVTTHILNAITRGTNVVIHCRGGLGRSGTIGACALVERGATAQDALLAVQRARGPQAPETEPQKEFVRRYEAERRAPRASPPRPAEAHRVLGCMLGGAIGDALGAAVEFLSWQEIQRQFGAGGVRGHEPAYGRKGAITDDTQMTLFTAEGLIRARVRSDTKGICHPPSIIHHAYLRWLFTQGVDRLEKKDGWLIQQRVLHARRAPGNTCLCALAATSLGDFEEVAPNDSKGCGGIMRVAPIGLVGSGAFALGTDAAAATHGHPSGYLSAAVFAGIMAKLFVGTPLRDAIPSARMRLGEYDDADEVRMAIDRAVELADEEPAAHVSQLGEGWVGEEAVGMSLFCALTAQDFSDGVLRSVNHGGDSDSTGSITGNLLGAMLGRDAIPRKWVDELEAREVIETVADDLVRHFVEECGVEGEWERDPGW